MGSSGACPRTGRRRSRRRNEREGRAWRRRSLPGARRPLSKQRRPIRSGPREHRVRLGAGQASFSLNYLRLSFTPQTTIPPISPTTSKIRSGFAQALLDDR